MGDYTYIRWFNEIGKDDISTIGGKAANLGELTRKGLNVPPGFCVTIDSYLEFINENELDEYINLLMYGIDVEDHNTLQNISEQIKKRIIDSEIPNRLREEIIDAYREFGENLNLKDPEVAVRSSAIEEDLPKASFAGQQDTYLYIKGEKEILEHIKMCWASLWNSRAIYYRSKQNIDHFFSSLSVIVQVMINSGKSGVLFTANPVNGNPKEMIINSSWGLGEAITSGIVTPDEYIIHKDKKQVLNKIVSEKKIMSVMNKGKIGILKVKVEDYLGEEKVNEESLNDNELKILINCGIQIEEIYGTYQNIEWGFDSESKELYILQSRPITKLIEKEEVELRKELKIIAKGISASPGFGMGRVRNIIGTSEINSVEKGDVIVATMTNPKMIPAMKRAAAVVTDEGGTTCHAAIVSRELQIPCIVGARNASSLLEDGMEISVDASNGVVYKGYIER